MGAPNLFPSDPVRKGCSLFRFSRRAPGNAPQSEPRRARPQGGNRPSRLCRRKAPRLPSPDVPACGPPVRGEGTRGDSSGFWQGMNGRRGQSPVVEEHDLPPGSGARAAAVKGEKGPRGDAWRVSGLFGPRQRRGCREGSLRLRVTRTRTRDGAGVWSGGSGAGPRTRPRLEIAAGAPGYPTSPHEPPVCFPPLPRPAPFPAPFSLPPAHTRQAGPLG